MIEKISNNIDKLKNIPIFLLIFSIIIIIVFKNNIDFGIEFKGGTLIEIVGKHNIVLNEYNYKLEYAKDSFGNYYTRIFLDKFLSTEEINNIIKKLEENGISREDVSINQISPTFGREFFKQVIIVLFVAFVLMSLGVIFRFKSLIPALTIILSVTSDIITTIALIILLGIEFTKGVFLALLLLIGYGVDSNVLLATRILKEYRNFKDGYVSAFKTGALMSLTTISAGIALYIFSASKILKDIALVAIMGLVSDFIYTWFLNSYLIKRILTRYKIWRF